MTNSLPATALAVSENSKSLKSPVKTNFKLGFCFKPSLTKAFNNLPCSMRWAKVFCTAGCLAPYTASSPSLDFKWLAMTTICSPLNSNSAAKDFLTFVKIGLVGSILAGFLTRCPSLNAAASVLFPASRSTSFTLWGLYK